MVLSLQIHAHNRKYPSTQYLSKTLEKVNTLTVALHYHIYLSLDIEPQLVFIPFPGGLGFKIDPALTVPAPLNIYSNE